MSAVSISALLLSKMHHLMAGLKVGWIGTGVMGKSMAEHLMNAGYKLAVFNRTQEKAQALVEKGAEFLSVSDIGRTCQVVFSMVGYPHDVEDVILGPSGLFKSMQPGSLFVDHTSSSPDLATRIYEEGRRLGIACLDAPVSGGDVGARTGKLAVMVGGDADAVTRSMEFLSKYGANIQHMGGAGMGQHTKLTNQIILAGNMIGMVEGLVYSHKAGLDLMKMIELISSGAAGSASLRILGPRIVNGDLEPGFYIEHYVKDMGIALDECRRMGICLPNLSLVNQFYQSLVGAGLSRKGTQALIQVLEKLNNVRISPHNA